MIVKEVVTLKLRRYKVHKNGGSTLYNLLVGQSDDNVIASLEKQTDYEQVQKRGDIIDLLCMVQELYASRDFGGT